MTDKQIENLRMAYAIMAGIPAERIKLDIYRCEPRGRRCENDKAFVSTCGSAGCVAGWLSAHPHFKSQGLKWFAPEIQGEPASSALFDDPTIFDSGPEGLTGKREALARIRRALYRAGAVDDARDIELRTKEMEMTS